jgi:hypothetical protein
MTGAEGAVTGSTVPADAGTVGAKATTGYRSNLTLGATTGAAMLEAQHTLTADGQLQVAAESAGRSVGSSFDQGIKAGIENGLAFIRGAARDAVNAAEKAAREAADSHSPSKLFAKLGEDLVAGLAVGLGNSDAVVAEAERIVRDTAAVFNDASFSAIQAPSLASGQIAAGAAMGGTQTNSFNFDVTVNVDGNMTQTQARTIGAQIADSAQVELLRRNVVARVRAAV